MPITIPKRYSVDDLHFDGYGDTEVVFADQNNKYTEELINVMRQLRKELWKTDNQHFLLPYTDKLILEYAKEFEKDFK